jgi:DNA-binding response OmpR family regulator
VSEQQKLLIVDDQPELRKMLRLVLDYGKYRFFEAGDGTSALDIVRTEKPDVVLLDLIPSGEVDSFGVCSAIKADPEMADCYVVMLAARSQAMDFTGGNAAGADACMVKPFSPTRLIELVEMRERPGEPVCSCAF